MGVYIKYMEMPDCCLRCLLFAGNGCNATKRIFPDWLNVAARPDTCPLVEVKVPHGRLIDADNFLKDMNCGVWNWDEVNGVPAITALTQIMSDFHYVPTVLEAEEKDDG